MNDIPEQNKLRYVVQFKELKYDNGWLTMAAVDCRQIADHIVGMYDSLKPQYEFRIFDRKEPPIDIAV